MTATVVLTVPRFRAFTQAGLPMAGGKVYTYSAGTTTPKATYSDLAGSSVNANPVVLDANGEATIRLDVSGGGYKIILKDASDVTQWTLDDVDSSVTTAYGMPTISGNNVWTGTYNKFASTEPRLILDDTDASSDKRLWDIEAQSGVLSLRTRTDADGAGKGILVATRGTGTALSTIAIGNSTDSPTTTCWGELQIPANGLTNGSTQTAEAGFYVRRTIDLSRGSSSTLTDDTQLTFTINGVTTNYILNGLLAFYKAGGTPGFKFGFSGLASGYVVASGSVNGSASAAAIVDNGNANFASISTATTVDMVHLFGRVTLTSGSPFTLQWCQASSDVNSTTLKSGSFIQLTRTAS